MLLMSPEADADLLQLWAYVSTLKDRLSQLGTVEVDPVTGAIIIRDLLGTTRVIIGYIGPTAADWGIQIYSPTGVLMYDSTLGGAFTEGIVADAVTSTGSVNFENIEAHALDALFSPVPDMSITMVTAGGVVLVTAALASVQITNTDAGATHTCVARLRVLRDTTVLTTTYSGVDVGPSTAIYVPMPLTYFDAGLPAGTYVYTLEWAPLTLLGFTPTIASLAQRTLQAVEIKR